MIQKYVGCHKVNKPNRIENVFRSKLAKKGKKKGSLMEPKVQIITNFGAFILSPPHKKKFVIPIYVALIKFYSFYIDKEMAQLYK